MKKILKTAFTLIELLVVIAIIGILSGLIVVTMNGVTAKAKIAKSQIFSNSLRNALMLNLVSEWKLDGNSNDSWSGANNGVWSGSAGGTNTSANYRPATECVSDQCLNFDGTDDYVDCGANSSLNFGNGTADSPFTLSGWFKLSDMTNKGLMGKYNGGNQYLFWTQTTDRLMLTLYDASTGGYIRRYYNAALISYENQWIYIVATYDGTAVSSGIKIYLNGTRVDDVSDSSGTYVAMEATGIFRIGAYGVGTYLSGWADDIRVFNATMPTSQIKEQYYAGLNNLLINGSISQSEYLERINETAKI